MQDIKCTRSDSVTAIIITNCSCCSCCTWRSWRSCSWTCWSLWWATLTRKSPKPGTNGNGKYVSTHSVLCIIDEPSWFR